MSKPGDNMVPHRGWYCAPRTAHIKKRPSEQSPTATEEKSDKKEKGK